MTSKITLELLDPRDKSWTGFVNTLPDANIFHHPHWMTFIAECYHHNPFVLAAKDNNGIILAGIPLIETNCLLVSKKLISLPFSDHCSPLYSKNYALNALLDYLAALYKKEKQRTLELRWELPSHPNITPYSHHVLSTITIAPSLEETFYNIHKRTRKYIRVSQKKGLTVKIGQSPEFIQEFYKLQILTRQKHGVPVQPKRFFDLLGKRIIARDLGHILLAYKDQQCVAGKIILHWNNTLTFKYSASDQHYLDLYPNYLLSWTAIKWGVENNYQLIDMGRSANSNTNLRQYKLKWGAVEKPLIYSTYSTTPSPISTRTTMKFINFLIKHTPRWVCRVSGEILYRHSA